MATIKFADNQVCVINRYTDLENKLTDKYEKFAKSTIKAFKKKKWQNGLKRRK